MIEKIGKSKVGKNKIQSKGHEYIFPRIRLPRELDNFIGQQLSVFKFEVNGKTGVILTPEEEFDQNNLDKLTGFDQTTNTQNKLQELEKQIQNLKNQTGEFKGESQKENPDNLQSMPKGGFEPPNLLIMSQAYDSPYSPGNSPVDYEAVLDFPNYKGLFINWLEKHGISMRNDIISKIEKLGEFKINDPRGLKEYIDHDFNPDTGRPTRTVAIALRDFMKFLIEEGYRTESQLIDYKAVVKIPASGIKTGKKAFTDSDTIIQARKRVNHDEVRSLVFDLITYGGIRMKEASELIQNFSPDELYYDGEIAYYDLLEMWKRIKSKKYDVSENTKREVICIMPKEVADKLERIPHNYTSLKGSANGGLAYQLVNASQIRKWFSNILNNSGVSEQTIEFLTGKTPEKVLRKHYLNLLGKAIEEYKQILPVIEEELTEGD